MQNTFASKTVVGLRQLFKYIDSKVLLRVWFLLPASILSGFLDFAAVAVIGRLTGSLIGSDLGNLLPGIKVFGASLYEQSLWLIAIFITVNWLQSGVRLALRLMQENLAESYGLIYLGGFSDRFWRSHMKIISGNVISLASDLLSNLEALLRDILTPALRAISCIISIVMLVAGILYVGGVSSFVLIISMLLMYIMLSYFITPTLRVASRLKIITRKDTPKVFLNLLNRLQILNLV